MEKIKNYLVVSSAIIALGLVVASWTYLQWLGPVIASILIAWLVFMAITFSASMWFTLIERWKLHRFTVEDYNVGIALRQGLVENTPSLIEALVEQCRQGLIYLDNIETFKMKTLPKAAVAQGEQPMMIPQIEPKPLLDQVGHLPRIVVVGGMGSGKTTVLLHLAKLKAETTETRIFDSHAFPAKWPHGSNTSVVGKGRDYSGISNNFRQLMGEMDTRFKEIGDGKVAEGAHPQITVIADEWTLLPTLVSGMNESAKSLFTEGRKASIGFAIAVHDLTVGALGLKGFSNLRESFDAIVHCEFDAKVNAYKTYIQWGWGNRVRQEAIPPGVYSGHTHTPTHTVGTARTTGTPQETVIIDLEDELTIPFLPPVPDEKSVVLDHYYRMVNSRETFSWNQLSLRCYGKKGGTYNDRMRSILDEYQVSYEEYM